MMNFRECVPVENVFLLKVTAAARITARRYKFSKVRFIDTVLKELSSELTFENYCCGAHYSAHAQV